MVGSQRLNWQMKTLNDNDLRALFYMKRSFDYFVNYVDEHGSGELADFIQGLYEQIDNKIRETSIDAK